MRGQSSAFLSSIDLVQSSVEESIGFVCSMGAFNRSVTFL